MTAPRGWSEIKAYYGWNDDYLAHLADWANSMVLVPPPDGRTFYFDKNENRRRDEGEGSRGLRVHRLIAGELTTCLQLVDEAGLWRFVESIAGGYAFRLQRNGDNLSMHSLGAAVDFDALRNPLRVPPEETALGTEPGLGVVRIFERRGWTWGGRWSRPDAMHFQFGGGY